MDLIEFREEVKTLPEEITLAGFGINRQVYFNEGLLLPERSMKVRKHSPDGFNWGYCGSGPAQLSLAIMLECCSQLMAENTYQLFKEVLVSRLADGSFYVKIYMRKLFQHMIDTGKAPAEIIPEFGEILTLNMQEIDPAKFGLTELPKEAFEKDGKKRI